MSLHTVLSKADVRGSFKKYIHNFKKIKFATYCLEKFDYKHMKSFSVQVTLFHAWILQNIFFYKSFVIGNLSNTLLVFIV